MVVSEDELHTRHDHPSVMVVQMMISSVTGAKFQLKNDKSQNVSINVSPYISISLTRKTAVTAARKNCLRPQEEEILRGARLYRERILMYPRWCDYSYLTSTSVCSPGQIPNSVNV